MGHTLNLNQFFTKSSPCSDSPKVLWIVKLTWVGDFKQILYLSIFLTKSIVGICRREGCKTPETLSSTPRLLGTSNIKISMKKIMGLTLGMMDVLENKEGALAIIKQGP